MWWEQLVTALLDVISGRSYWGDICPAKSGILARAVEKSLPVLEEKAGGPSPWASIAMKGSWLHTG